MISIDQYAYASKLKQANPTAKLLFCILPLAICLWAGSIPVSLLTILVMGGTVVRKGGTPPAVFFRLLLAPAAFLVIGVLTVAVSVSRTSGGFLIYLPAFGHFAGVSQASLLQAGGLFFKALGSVSCLYFLSLSTPMLDLLSLLRRLRVPKLMVELMSLIYRFIFVLLETAETMLTAQNSRLGYSSFQASYRSIAMAAATLFIRAYKRSDELYTALEARGYDGELNVLEETHRGKPAEFLPPVVVGLSLAAVVLLLRWYGVTI